MVFDSTAETMSVRAAFKQHVSSLLSPLKSSYRTRIYKFGVCAAGLSEAHTGGRNQGRGRDWKKEKLHVQRLGLTRDLAVVAHFMGQSSFHDPVFGPYGSTTASAAQRHAAAPLPGPEDSALEGLVASLEASLSCVWTSDVRIIVAVTQSANVHLWQCVITDESSMLRDDYFDHVDTSDDGTRGSGACEGDELVERYFGVKERLKNIIAKCYKVGDPNGSCNTFLTESTAQRSKWLHETLLCESVYCNYIHAFGSVSRLVRWRASGQNQNLGVVQLRPNLGHFQRNCRQVCHESSDCSGH